MRGFRDLQVWQKAIELVTEMYRVTADFPADERFGLTSQLRRAAVSVPSNIAEGHGRHTPGEFLQFLGHARGSLCEVETQLTIANNLGFLKDPAPLLERASEIARMLNGLMRSLRTDSRVNGTQSSVVSSRASSWRTENRQQGTDNR